MRAISFAFPFRSTFRRLELEKRWWHRLCIVTFFAVQLCAAVFTAWVAYTVFAPQVATMPDIETGFSDQPHLSSEADVNSILTEADRAVLPSNIPLPPQGAHVAGTMTLKEFGQRIKAKYPVYNDLDDEALARSVVAKYPQYGGVIKDSNRAAPIDLSAGFVPKAEPSGGGGIDRSVSTMSVQGWSISNSPQPTVPAHNATKAKTIPEAVNGKPVQNSDTSVTLDLTSFQPIVKLAQMPDGSTSRFPSTVSDDNIKAQWNHAKTSQTLKAIMWAGLLTFVSALFISYLFQIAYRTLLYVIFGTVVHAVN